MRDATSDRGAVQDYLIVNLPKCDTSLRSSQKVTVFPPLLSSMTYPSLFSSSTCLYLKYAATVVDVSLVLVVLGKMHMAFTAPTEHGTVSNSEGVLGSSDAIN